MVTSATIPARAYPTVIRPRQTTFFNPPPPIIEADRAEVIHRIRLVAGQMIPAVKVHLEYFSGVILKVGAKLHADIQVLGLF